MSLIKLALEQAPGFMATYDQICHWIEQTFPYYKSTSNEWKVSLEKAMKYLFYYHLHSYKSFLFYAICIDYNNVVYLQIFIKQALLMTPSCFLRINTADQNCYWTLSGKVPQIQPDNHVLILIIFLNNFFF